MPKSSRPWRPRSRASGSATDRRDGRRTRTRSTHPQSGCRTLARRPMTRCCTLFTSGTTSRPKLVEHSHASYPVGHLSTMYWLGLQPGDVHLAIARPAGPSTPGVASSRRGLPRQLSSSTTTPFDAPKMLDTIRTERVTSFCAPPTVWRMLIQADLATGPGALREVVSAGEPLNPEVISQVRSHWGLTIRDGYGQTEMKPSSPTPPASPSRTARWAAASGLSDRSCRSAHGRTGPGGRDLHRPVGASDQPHDRLCCGPGAQRRIVPPADTTIPETSPCATTTDISLTSDAPTTSSKHRTTRSPLRA